MLRIRPNSYYRIELPLKSSEDKIQVEEFKVILAKVLSYEVTPCPFKRGFTVDLPELPKTPVQKRPWRPKPKLANTPENVPEKPKEFDFGPRSPRTQFSTVERDDVPEASESSSRNRRVSHITSSDVSSIESDNEPESEATDETEISPRELAHNGGEEQFNLKTPTRPKSLRTGRADTAPPQLSLTTTSPSSTVNNALPLLEPESESPSLSSSLDSFHSFHSPISPLAPSPHFPGLDPLSKNDIDGISIPRLRSHKRDVSEITVTGDSSELWDMTNRRSSDEITIETTAEVSGTPPLIDDAASDDDENWCEAVTPSPTKEIRRRRLPSRPRTESPLPPSANLYSPYSPRSHISGHHLTTAILQRTCSLLLGPPVQLVALMLRIAAKLAKGTFRGSSFGFGEGGQKIPCSWDFSDGSDDNEEEDDYGVPLSRPASENRRAKETSGSWEID